MTIYCATTNPGKLREFRLAASSVCSVEPLPGLSEIPPCEETGSTFEENAIQKALYYGAHTSGLLFVDDSGLEVNALGGAPGVFSARYAGPNAADEENNGKLLLQMAAHQYRTARFVSVIALANRGALMATFRGVVEGQLLREARGSNGFGYDPLFYYAPFQSSFGEIEPDRKQTVSHRGQALRQMVEFLQRFPE